MKTIFQDLESLHNHVQEEEAKKILTELEQNFHLLRTKTGLMQLMQKKRLQKSCMKSNTNKN